MKKNSLISIALFAAVILTWTTPNALAKEVVASLKDIRGQIEVERQNNTLTARNGLILYDKDTVITGYNSKATVVFRDGSIIRLFANTHFLIERSVEIKKGSRHFLNNLMLKLGSFWGKFSKKYQKTTIHTPTATAGIKGTIISMAVQNNQLDVSLTTGEITLQNDDETIRLQPGKIVRGITRRGSIENKIKDLPYELIFKADKAEIRIPDTGDPIDVYFTLQMVHKSMNKNVFRSGPVYISHEFDNISFEPDILLNTRGYARIKATIMPFQEKDSLRETIRFTAIMDGEDYIDVDAGQTSLTFLRSGRKSKTMKFDVESDKIE